MRLPALTYSIADLLPAVVLRFHAKYERRPGRCWEWTAHRNSWGYGRFRCGKRLWLAPRFQWVLCRGRIPRGKLVLHNCDNPGCVNPNHLWLGTNMDNSKDKIAKGRDRPLRGVANGRAILTESDVREIRSLAEDGVSIREMAEHYDVGESTIGYITTRRSWAHI